MDGTKKINLLDSKFIFFSITIPLTILFLIFLGFYNLINSQLQPLNKEYWFYFFMIDLFINLSFTIYAIICVIKKITVHKIIFPVILILNISFIYFIGYSFQFLFPDTVPQWVANFQEIFLYIGTFIIPSILYSLFGIVHILTDLNKKQLIWNNFLISIIIPVFWYIFFTYIFYPFAKGMEYKSLTHLIIVLFIIISVVFYFFLLRGVYLVLNKFKDKLKKFDLAIKIIFTLVFPILGLLLNEGFFYKDIGSAFHSIFGDFSNPLFFILTIVNGIFLSIPQIQNVMVRRILFFLRILTLSFTFYFFVTFLPFFPFAIVATFFLGLGFLIISPLILGFIHINTLREDYLFLKENFSTLLKKIVLSISGCLLIITIPILIIINFSFERINLDNTLTYLYQVDYEKNKVPDINVNLLKKSLDNMIKQKSRNRFSTERTPFISQLYSYIVFDNLILSDEKISYIEKVFFSKRSIINNQNTQIKRDIKITELDYKTIYKKEDRLFHSYIDLKIKNFEKFDNVEYFTNIFLPKGSWVNNYYLYINDKKKYGLLAEKKSVLWIYNEIKNINRDPGILYYKDNENISLKVFPFFENEERKTGFEIIHIEPIELNIDENKIFLTDNSAKEAEELDNNYDFINYIDNNKINNLEKVTLKPYYHFIVDCSLGKKDTINVQLNKIKNILNKNLIKDYENSKITFLNHTYKTYNIKDKFENDIYKLKFEGGFFFDRIVKKNLFDTFKNEQLYPVIIVLNDEIDNIIWDKSILNFKWINPDLKFYHINNNNQIFEYNLFDFDISENKEITGFNNYNGYLLNINGTKRIVPIQNKPFYIYDFTKEIKNLQPVKLVDKALYLEYLSKYNLIYPNKEEDKFMEILKNSFSSNILTQLTSFVVLENEMQVKMLKKKQDEVINGKKYFDTTEETVQEMSEPGLIIMFIIFIIIIGIRFFIYKLWNKKNL